MNITMDLVCHNAETCTCYSILTYLTITVHPAIYKHQPGNNANMYKTIV